MDMNTVLVIEGDRNQRLLYKQELEEEGYRVLLAGDPRIAIFQLEIHAPDLVVVGVGGMGEWDMSLLQRLQKYRKDTALVANTTQFDECDQIAGQVDAYVIKSSDLTSLKDVIRVLLRMPNKSVCFQSLDKKIAAI
jgi:DNA-binding response OmpR family regulator